ncbi:MAG: F0F1 ATP synthase subunit alpha, partial [Rhodoglobus sp.]|nr:F0F1 ATP synthase subunit alpha [Rhodoglobus sp.]
DILRFQSELHDYLARNTKVLDTLRETNVLDDDTTAALDAGVDKFKLEFQTSEGKSLGTEVFEELAEEEIEQEQIVKQKRKK